MLGTFTRDFSYIFPFNPIILMQGIVISINTRKYSSQWRTWDFNPVRYHQVLSVTILLANE